MQRPNHTKAPTAPSWDKMAKVAEKLPESNFEGSRPGRTKMGFGTEVGIFEKNGKTQKNEN